MRFCRTIRITNLYAGWAFDLKQESLLPTRLHMQSEVCSIDDWKTYYTYTNTTRNKLNGTQIVQRKTFGETYDVSRLSQFFPSKAGQKLDEGSWCSTLKGESWSLECTARVWIYLIVNGIGWKWQFTDLHEFLWVVKKEKGKKPVKRGKGFKKPKYISKCIPGWKY